MISEFDYCAPLDLCPVCGHTIFKRGDKFCSEDCADQAEQLTEENEEHGN